MQLPLPSVLWPAPGSPAMLSAGDTELPVIAACGSDGEIHSALETGRWCLEAQRSGRQTPLKVLRVGPLRRGQLPPHAQPLAELLPVDRSKLVEIWLRPLGPLRSPPPSPPELQHLTYNGQIVRTRAVAACGPSHRLRLAFAADLHLAGFWDRLHADAQGSIPHLARRMLHPTRLWRQFVAEANEQWRQGNLDLVVLGGDLVEYVFDPARAEMGRPRTTNIDRLLQALEPLEAPTITLPGNHEHRAYGWRPRLYGLQAVGLSAAEGRELLRATGRWGRGWLRPSDLDALRVYDEQSRPALLPYLQHISPGHDFVCNLGGLRMIFLSTGCDALARWRTLDRNRLGSLAASPWNLWRLPDAEGLNDEQAAWLSGLLQDPQPTAVFSHAPILHPGDGPYDDQALSFSHSPRDRAQLRLERRLRCAGFTAGGCLRNSGVVLHALAQAPGPVALFSAHVHRAGAVRLDRRRGCLHCLPLQALPANMLQPDRCDPLFLSAPAVGQLSPTGDGQPGYLFAEFQAGQLVDLQRVYLHEHQQSPQSDDSPHSTGRPSLAVSSVD